MVKCEVNTYLNALDFEEAEEAVCVITGEPYYAEVFNSQTNKKDRRCHIPVEVNGDERTYLPNATSQRKIIGELQTDEMDQWVGAVLIFNIKAKNVGGNMTDCLFVSEASYEPKQRSRPAAQPKAPAARPAPTKPAQNQPMAEDMVCKDCKKPISEAEYNFSTSRYHTALCRTCQPKYAPVLNRAKAAREEQSKVSEENIGDDKQ